MTGGRHLEDDEIYEAGGEMPTSGTPIDPEAFAQLSKVVRFPKRPQASEPSARAATEAPPAEEVPFPSDEDCFGADFGAAPSGEAPPPTEPANDNGLDVDAEHHELNLEPIIPDEWLPDGVLAGTDVAGAHLLAHHYGEDVRYSPKIGWLCWDGRRHLIEGKDATRVSIRVQNIGRRLQLGAAELYRRAALTRDAAVKAKLQDRADALQRWAKYVQSAAGIRHIIEVARTHVPVDVDQLDRDHWLLNCQNGTVELRAGTLREHRRSDLITKVAPICFDPDARCPRWEAFISEILPKEDVRGFVKRYYGYAITGVTRDQCFVIALGPGANGKSVLAEAVRSVLGDYTRDSPTDTFMHTGSGRGTENDIARLRGARFVTAKETQEDRRLDEARVKQLTGEDTVTARFLFHEHFEYVPSFKLWLYCNHRPKITGVDDGIWRRVMLVLFDVTIPPEKRDRDLKEKLLAEAPGILAWLVAGCSEWQQVGLQPPASVTAGTAAWRAESDEVRSFVEECCVVKPFATVKPDPLFARYQVWAQQNGNKSPLSYRCFKARMEGLGFTHGKTGDLGRHYKGIGLLAEVDDDN